MASSIDLEGIALFFEKRWPTRWGLFGAAVLAAGALQFFLPKAWPAVAGLVAHVLVQLAVFLAWYLNRQPEKTKKGKVGIVISLACESPDVDRKIRSDFGRTLRDLISQGRTGASFQVIEVPDHISQGVRDVEDAQALRRRTGCHFLLWGRVRVRHIDGQPQHLLKMEGLVSHREIPKTVSARIGQEFTELLPRRVLVAFENDVFAFDFISAWTEHVAKYIVAIASTVSGNLDYAEQLYRDLEDKLKGVGTSAFIATRTIQERIPRRLAEISVARATVAFRRWFRDKDQSSIAEMGHALECIDEKLWQPAGAVILRAIYLFLESRDVEGGISLLEQHKLEGDPSWHFGLAFLHAYNGDTKKAIRIYRQIEQGSFDDEAFIYVLDQVVEFFHHILDVEPGRLQLRYCLGFVYWKLKRDRRSAQKELALFLNACPHGSYEKERGLAEEWLRELKAEIEAEVSG